LVNTSFGYFTVRYVGAPPPGTSADDPGCDIGVYIGPNANNSIISNVTMIDFEAGIWVDGATNVQISGSTLAENYVGLYVANSHGGGSVNVTRTTFFDNGGGAYLFRNAMSTFGFGNTFTDNGVGVDSWEADTNVKLGTFLNNWYAGTFYYDSTGGVTNSSSTGANCGFAFAIAGSTPYINFFANTAAFNWYGFWFYQVPGFDMWLNLQNSFDIGFGNTHNSYFGQSGFPYDCEYFEENPPITNRDTSIPAPRTK